jgi:predicted ATPase
MASILGFRVRNYRMLQDITFGQLWNKRGEAPLSALTAVIGKNGVGKSTLFDAFGFLSDCLRLGIEEACDSHNRGGFERIRSQSSLDPISFEVYYREDAKSRPITYEVSFDVDVKGRPFVKSERLRQRRAKQTTGWPFSFLVLNDGKGAAWRGDSFGINLREDEPGGLTLEQILDSDDEEVPDIELSKLTTLGDWASPRSVRCGSIPEFLRSVDLSRVGT